MLGRFKGDDSAPKQDALRSACEFSWQTFAEDTRDREGPSEFKPLALKTLDPLYPTTITAQYSSFIRKAALSLEVDNEIFKAVILGCDGLQEQFFQSVAAAHPVGRNAYGAVHAEDDFSTDYGRREANRQQQIGQGEAEKCEQGVKYLKALIKVCEDCREEIGSPDAEGHDRTDTPEFLATVPYLLEQSKCRVNLLTVMVVYWHRKVASSESYEEAAPRVCGCGAVSDLARLGFVEEAVGMGLSLVTSHLNERALPDRDWLWRGPPAKPCGAAHVPRSDPTFPSALVFGLLPCRGWWGSLRDVKAAPFTGAAKDLLEKRGVALHLWDSPSARFLAAGEMMFLPVGGTIGAISEDLRCLTAVIREKYSKTTLVVRMSRDHRMSWVLEQALEALHQRVQKQWSSPIKKKWSSQIKNVLEMLQPYVERCVQSIKDDACSAPAVASKLSSTLIVRIRQLLPFVDSAVEDEVREMDAFYTKVRYLNKVQQCLEDLFRGSLKVEVQFFGLGLAGAIFPPEMSDRDQISVLAGVLQSSQCTASAKSLAAGCLHALHVIIAELKVFCENNSHRIAITRACLGGLDGVGLFEESAQDGVASKLPADNITPKIKNMLYLQSLAIHNSRKGLIVKPVLPLAQKGVARAVLSCARLICDPSASDVMEVDYDSFGDEGPALLFSAKAIQFLRKYTGLYICDVRAFPFTVDDRACFLGCDVAVESDMAAFALTYAFDQQQRVQLRMMIGIHSHLEALQCDDRSRSWMLSRIGDFLARECPIYVGHESDEANKNFIQEIIVKLLPPLADAIRKIPVACLEDSNLRGGLQPSVAFQRPWAVFMRELKASFESDAVFGVGKGGSIFYEIASDELSATVDADNVAAALQSSAVAVEESVEAHETQQRPTTAPADAAVPATLSAVAAEESVEAHETQQRSTTAPADAAVPATLSAVAVEESVGAHATQQRSTASEDVSATESLARKEAEEFTVNVSSALHSLSAAFSRW